MNRRNGYVNHFEAMSDNYHLFQTAQGVTMRLLYVEDEISLVRVVELLLRQAGFEIDIARCGQDAVKLARTNHYDLIILDIMLPDFDGYEVIERIGKHGIDAQFLIQTGVVSRKDEANGVSLGATEHLLKPFTSEELINGIERVLARAKFVERAKLDVSEEAPKDKRRRHHRFKSQTLARIVGLRVLDCKIIDIGGGGAALRLSHPKQEIPPNFGLSIESIDEIECEVCWRVGDKVGVKFV